MNDIWKNRKEENQDLQKMDDRKIKNFPLGKYDGQYRMSKDFDIPSENWFD